MKLRVRGQHRGKAIALVFAAFLGAIFAIDAMQVVRPSGVAAMSCVTTLIREPADAGQLVSVHRDTIVHQSRLNTLPSVLVAAVIFDHQDELTRSSAFTDCFGSALGANLSL